MWVRDCVEICRFSWKFSFFRSCNSSSLVKNKSSQATNNQHLVKKKHSLGKHDKTCIRRVISSLGHLVPRGLKNKEMNPTKYGSPDQESTAASTKKAPKTASKTTSICKPSTGPRHMFCDQFVDELPKAFPPHSRHRPRDQGQCFNRGKGDEAVAFSGAPNRGDLSLAAEKSTDQQSQNPKEPFRMQLHARKKCPIPQTSTAQRPFFLISCLFEHQKGCRQRTLCHSPLTFIDMTSRHLNLPRRTQWKTTFGHQNMQNISEGTLPGSPR